MEIKVVGPGCKSCKELFKVTKKAITTINEKIDIVHIDSLEEMMSYGIVKSPGLVINDEVVSQGKRLNENEVLNLIKNKK